MRNGIGFAMLLMGAQAGALECKNVPGANALLVKGATVLVGGLQGTHEVPAAFAELACLAAKNNVPLRVGLELPPPELGPIEKFVDGGERDALLQAAPFKKARQDGRTSAGIVELLERLKALRHWGAKIHLVLFDAEPGDPSLRPLLMSQTLAGTRNEAKNDLMLVLLAPEEAVLNSGKPTVAQQLTQRKVKFVSLNATHAGGSAWTCEGTNCGEHKIAGQPGGKALTIQLDPKLGAYSGTLFVGPITVAGPAH